MSVRGPHSALACLSQPPIQGPWAGDVSLPRPPQLLLNPKQGVWLALGALPFPLHRHHSET